MTKALAVLALVTCLAGAGAAAAQTQTRSAAPARNSVNTAASVAIPRNVEPSCTVSREQVPRADGTLEWRTRTDCNRDPY